MNKATSRQNKFKEFGEPECQGNHPSNVPVCKAIGMYTFVEKSMLLYIKADIIPSLQ